MEIEQLDMEELNFLKEELDAEEIFILGFLKGFDRGVMRKWIEEGIWVD